MQNKLFIISLSIACLAFSSCKRNSISENIDSVFQQFIDSSWLPQAVAYVEQDGKILHFMAYGYSNIEDSVKCQSDDIFRLASQTKAITVVGFMQLYEQGLFSLDDPLEKYIPEFEGKGITIFHLLTHTSGICSSGEWDKEYKKAGALAHNSSDTLSLKENCIRMAKLPLKHQPGQQFTYANNTDIIGRLIEIISGEDYVSYIQNHILNPLEMNHTYFYLPDSQQQKLVRLYANDSLGLHSAPEENLFAYGSYPSPSAGLCGTIEDYANFCRMVLEGGIYTSKIPPYSKRRILEKETLQLIEQNQIGNLRSDTLGFGFAWDYFIQSSTFNSNTLRWGGMYGTDYIIDLDNKLILILYTNCMPNLSGHNHKQAFINTVYNSFAKHPNKQIK